MPQPCEQAEVIKAQGLMLAEQGTVLNEIRQAQKRQEKIHSDHASELKESITKMTDILIESTKHSADIAQLKRETNLLFEQDRVVTGRVELIEQRNAKCDGAGIFERFPEVWDWFQQERGWRRFLPTFMAFLAWCASIWAFFENHK